MFSYEINKPSEISIKSWNAADTLNQIFKILRYPEQMIISSNMYEKTHKMCITLQDGYILFITLQDKFLGHLRCNQT